MTREATKCASKQCGDKSIANSRGLVQASSALVIFTHKGILDSSLVQIVLEQEGGHKRVVIIRKGFMEASSSSSLSRVNPMDRKSRMRCIASSTRLINDWRSSSSRFLMENRSS